MALFVKSVDFPAVPSFTLELPLKIGEGSWLTDKSKRFILWFNEIGIEDIPMVGGKTLFREMYQNLHQQGINIPNGFCHQRLCLPLLSEVRGH